MSLGLEYLADCAFERDFPFGVPNPTNPIWTTKTKKKIPVKNMTMQHIWCCMDLVGEDDLWYGVFAAEIKRRFNAHF